MGRSLLVLSALSVAGCHPRSPISETPTYPPWPSETVQFDLFAAEATVQSLGCVPDDTSGAAGVSPLRVLIGTCKGSDDSSYRQSFFFYNNRYIGTGGGAARIKFRWKDGQHVALEYALYNDADPACCPSGGAALIHFWYGQGRFIDRQDPLPAGVRGPPGNSK